MTFPPRTPTRLLLLSTILGIFGTDVFFAHSHFCPDEFEHKIKHFNDLIKTLSWELLQRNAEICNFAAFKPSTTASASTSCASQALRELNEAAKIWKDEVFTQEALQCSWVPETCI